MQISLQDMFQVKSVLKRCALVQAHQRPPEQEQLFSLAEPAKKSLNSATIIARTESNSPSLLLVPCCAS